MPAVGCVRMSGCLTRHRFNMLRATCKGNKDIGGEGHCKSRLFIVRNVFVIQEFLVALPMGSIKRAGHE